jgi:hypothetical protein
LAPTEKTPLLTSVVAVVALGFSVLERFN